MDVNTGIVNNNHDHYFFLEELCKADWKDPEPSSLSEFVRSFICKNNLTFVETTDKEVLRDCSLNHLSCLKLLSSEDFGKYFSAYLKQFIIDRPLEEICSLQDKWQELEEEKRLAKLWAETLSPKLQSHKDFLLSATDEFEGFLNSLRPNNNKVEELLGQEHLTQLKKITQNLESKQIQITDIFYQICIIFFVILLLGISSNYTRLKLCLSSPFVTTILLGWIVLGWSMILIFIMILYPIVWQIAVSKLESKAHDRDLARFLAVQSDTHRCLLLHPQFVCLSITAAAYVYHYFFSEND